MKTIINLLLVTLCLSACNKPDDCNGDCYKAELEINGRKISIDKAPNSTDYPYFICGSSYIITPFDDDSLVLTYNTDIRLLNGEAFIFSLGIKAAYTDVDTLYDDSTVVYRINDQAILESYLASADGRFVPTQHGVNTPSGLVVTYKDADDKLWTTANYAQFNSAMDINSDNRFVFSTSTASFKPIYQQQLDADVDGWVIGFEIKVILWDDNGNEIGIDGVLEIPFCK
jgi:hypothetical protein